MTLRYAGTLARTPRPTDPHWRRVPRRTARPTNGREARGGGAGRHRGRVSRRPLPLPPRPGRGSAGAGPGSLIRGSLWMRGGGDATQGGKLATAEARAGFVLLPRALLTGPRLPPRRGDRGREVGAGAGRRVGPQQLGWARGAGRCPQWVAGARPGLVYEHRCPEPWVDGSSVLFPRPLAAARGAPRNRPTLRGRPPPPPAVGSFRGVIRAIHLSGSREVEVACSGCNRREEEGVLA